MPAPGIKVTIGARRAARGARLDTATGFLLGFASAGPYNTPTEFASPGEFAATFGAPTAYGLGSQSAEALLRIGGGTGFFVRVGGPETGRTPTEDNHATAADADWLRARDSLQPKYGQGQILAPGMTSLPVLQGLQTHAVAHGRFAVLDAPVTTDKAALLTHAGALVNGPGSEASALAGYTCEVPDGADGDRELPGSVHLAGVIAHSDRTAGFPNVLPIGPTAGAGRAPYVTGLTHDFSDDDLDDLYDAGVSIARSDDGVYVDGTRTLAVASEEWRQIGWYRQLQSLGARIHAAVSRLKGGTDGLISNAEALTRIRTAISGPVADDYARGALYGDTPEDAYEVIVEATPADLAQGLVNASVEVSLSPSLERAHIDLQSIPLAA